ncbi:hypothetical protein BDK51DRAFT_35102 [Blyttiomyces helicus]|uniref:Uncharacterized protein n=1 Tax=Blyttiomyces helicus TaxID=388810 RepID=A0A4P9WK28_9FUNG|nr:hypothetical protein BDK51DRAFT_35102 [Blyttiomyces helicus]|eukprot:RKO93319.1 hypothetical protein BDK51DRAFT_35102 [Blyttiomyces helicus]
MTVLAEDPWTDLEDQILRDAVQKHENDWEGVQKYMQTKRNIGQIQERAAQLVIKKKRAPRQKTEAELGILSLHPIPDAAKKRADAAKKASPAKAKDSPTKRASVKGKGVAVIAPAAEGFAEEYAVDDKKMLNRPPAQEFTGLPPGLVKPPAGAIVYQQPLIRYSGTEAPAQAPIVGKPVSEVISLLRSNISNKYVRQPVTPAPSIKKALSKFEIKAKPAETPKEEEKAPVEPPMTPSRRAAHAAKKVTRVSSSGHFVRLDDEDDDIAGVATNLFQEQAGRSSSTSYDDLSSGSGLYPSLPELSPPVNIMEVARASKRLSNRKKSIVAVDEPENANEPEITAVAAAVEVTALRSPASARKPKASSTLVITPPTMSELRSVTPAKPDSSSSSTAKEELFTTPAPTSPGRLAPPALLASPARVASPRTRAAKSSGSTSASRKVAPADSAPPSTPVPDLVPQPTEDVPRTLTPTRASPRIANRNLATPYPVSGAASSSTAAAQASTPDLVSGNPSRSAALPPGTPYPVSGAASKKTAVPAEAPMSPGSRSQRRTYVTRLLDEEIAAPLPNSPLAHEYEGDDIDMSDAPTTSAASTPGVPLPPTDSPLPPMAGKRKRYVNASASTSTATTTLRPAPVRLSDAHIDTRPASTSATAQRRSKRVKLSDDVDDEPSDEEGGALGASPVAALPPCKKRVAFESPIAVPHSRSMDIDFEMFDAADLPDGTIDLLADDSSEDDEDYVPQELEEVEEEYEIDGEDDDREESDQDRPYSDEGEEEDDEPIPPVGEPGWLTNVFRKTARLMGIW